MKKFRHLFGALLCIIVLAALLALSIAAADQTVVFLKDGGTGDGATADTAVGSLYDAYNRLDLSKDCTVVVCGVFTQEDMFSYGVDYDGSVTFTSVFDGVDYRQSGAVYQFKPARFVCFGDTRFANMDFVALGTNLLVIGQHHPVTIGEGVTMTGDKMTGGSVAKAFAILGGYQSGQDDPLIDSDQDTHITVLSGSKVYIVAFSRQLLGRYTGTAHIYVGGNADVHVVNTAAYPDGLEIGDIELTVDGDAVIRNFYGCTQDSRANSFTLNWKSGKINLFEWTCSYTPSKLIVFTEGTKLIASETAKNAENFMEIAANFDTIVNETPATVVRMTLGQTTYTANGAEKTMDVAPIIRQSRTMLPVRYVAEALGAKVDWDGKTSTATITGESAEIRITVGASSATVNGVATELDSPAFIENNRTYMPVRFVAEALGAKVDWDGATSTATLTK